jgi:hypothetical protein
MISLQRNRAAAEIRRPRRSPTAARRVAAAVAALLLTPAAGAAAAAIELDAQLQGNAVAVAASARLNVPYAVIWQTLTDYNHLAEFVPGMTASHVVERHGNAVLVGQTGASGILFFVYPMDVVVVADEDPPQTIVMRLHSGNLRQFAGVYSIEPAAAPDQYVLRWDGVVEPDIMLPPIIGPILLRNNIEQQFRGVVEEIERRAGARPTGRRDPRQ